ncbi:MAG TPA: pyroglutamyl-peptidase I [Acetobacteraceae bacterium]|nr:pyroglutamyl-peptidase I [Acetobacteraceae bacterium]
MLRVLLTGFAPFGGSLVNPSGRAVAALAEASPLPGIALATAVLPVTYAGALPALRAALAAHAPDVVLATGLAGGRAPVSVERVAVNIDDARVPDNDGVQRIDAPVVPDGPAAYFASIPIKTITAAIRDAGVPAEVSQSAGTFLCNHVFYHACHLAAIERPGLRAGFIHLPWLPEQAVRHPAAPSMALDDVLRALRATLAVLRDTAAGADLRVAEGAVS